MPERFPVDFDGHRVTATSYAASNPLGLTLLLGHGVRAGQEDEFMVEYATGLAQRGVLVVTYDFPFAQRGRRVPDRSDVLEACCRAAMVAARQCRPTNQLFVGGKSLGGRVASRIAAEGGPEMSGVRGLVILGYPLHAVGMPGRRREHHLSRIDAPVFIAQGSRDPLGKPDDLRAVTADLPMRSEIYVVEGGDHSLAVRRSEPDASARSHARVQDEIVRWMTQVASTEVAASDRARPRPVASHKREQLRFLHRRPS
ncbi:MAG TPA: alpha/beta family hydrolase [Polyangiaceae bacterium]|nr:alpha/beta family hydrolase [Polyangiaceae bacterium]